MTTTQPHPALLDPDVVLALATIQADLHAIGASVSGAHGLCVAAERAFAAAFAQPSDAAWARTAGVASDLAGAFLDRDAVGLYFELSVPAAAALERLRAFAAENRDLIDRRTAPSRG